jgi:hypothetical protein
LRNMYRGFVLMQAEWIGVDKELLTEGKVEVLANQVEKYFPAPFQLYLDIVGRLVGNPGLDIYKEARRNWYWDYQMLFYISRTAMTLVTDDGDMRKASIAAGIGDKVISLKEYCDDLGVTL